LLLLAVPRFDDFILFVVVLLMAVLSVLMVSRVKYPKVNGVPQACGGALILILFAFYAFSLPLSYPSAVLLALISIYACLPLLGK